MTAAALVPTVANAALAKRVGPYRIVKGHVEGRVYRVLVLDMRRKVGDRQVYRAQQTGWSKAERENAATWAIEMCRVEGISPWSSLTSGREGYAESLLRDGAEVLA